MLEIHGIKNARNEKSTFDSRWSNIVFRTNLKLFNLSKIFWVLVGLAKFFLALDIICGNLLDICGIHIKVIC